MMDQPEAEATVIDRSDARLRIGGTIDSGKPVTFKSHDIILGSRAVGRNLGGMHIYLWFF
jgi:hypothetical protein